MDPFLNEGPHVFSCDRELGLERGICPDFRVCLYGVHIIRLGQRDPGTVAIMRALTRQTIVNSALVPTPEACVWIRGGDTELCLREGYRAKGQKGHIVTN